MSKLLVVFGATGQQGRSVVNNVLADAQLSKEYKIRAITRDTSKPAAAELAAKGVEVVAADLEDKASVEKAVKGAYAVFLYTVSIYDRKTSAKEEEQGKTAADACLGAGVKLLIFSSTPDATKVSGGKYTRNTIFDHPAHIEAYIRTLPIKSAVVLPGSFMQNFTRSLMPRPSKEGDGSYALMLPFPAKCAWPFLACDEDLGKFVGAILAAPDADYSRAITAAENMYTYAELAEIMSKVSGKEVGFAEVPEQAFKGFLPPTFDEEMLEMMLFSAHFSYYGPNAYERVAEDRKFARGKLTSVEEYLTKNPLGLA